MLSQGTIYLTQTPHHLWSLSISDMKSLSLWQMRPLVTLWDSFELVHWSKVCLHFRFLGSKVEDSEPCRQTGTHLYLIIYQTTRLPPCHTVCASNVSKHPATPLSKMTTSVEFRILKKGTRVFTTMPIIRRHNHTFPANCHAWIYGVFLF